MNSPKVSYAIRDAADAVGFSVDHLKKEIHAGRLKAKKPGRKYLISADALREWFDSLPDA